ncbi:MAG: Xaa-Pro aminopeptidase, partial [Ekhidna sp.]
MKKFLILLLISPLTSIAQNPYLPKILSMQERAEVIDNWLKERVETVLPEIMNRSGIDMWIVIAREYNEDPVIKTLLPATWQSARRTTMLIAYNPGNGKSLETFGMSRYNTGELFKTIWNKEEQPDQWKALADMIADKD